MGFWYKVLQACMCSVIHVLMNIYVYVYVYVWMIVVAVGLVSAFEEVYHTLNNMVILGII